MNDPCDPLPNETDVRESNADLATFSGEGVLSDEHFGRIAKALADPQRFAILQCIAGQIEMPCKTLVAEFPITQATISHHLKELVAAELIHSRRDGQMAILSCRRDVCRAYSDWLRDRLDGPSDR